MIWFPALRRTLLAAFAAFVIASVHAQPPAAPKPGDDETAAFLKFRDDREAKVDAVRMHQVITDGVALVLKFPNHNRTANVINAVARYGDRMRTKELAALRESYVAQLKFALVDTKSKVEGEDALLAFASLDTAVAGYEAEMTRNRGAVETFRRKIDDLAKMPNATRFLSGHEKAFIELLYSASPASAEKHATKLLESPDKKVVAMAKDQIALIKLADGPFELTFKATDGTEVDVSKLRGKPLYIYVWSTTSERAMRDWDTLKTVLEEVGKKNVNLITICVDKEEDREKVLKTIKDKRLPGFHHFDGLAGKSPLVDRLAARSNPGGLLFNSVGLVFDANCNVNGAKAALPKLIAADKKK